MPELVWDQVGDRVYETGLDRGVLYLPNGSAVPWNGLTSIIESFDKEVEPVYFDGMKISDLTTLGSFSASMTAVTYPEEFVELEGFAQSLQGIFYADQMPQAFGLCYRTQIGNDVDGPEAGHKIHILYNVTAIPSDKTYATASADPSLVEFEWQITAVPEELPGIRPTAHIVLDTRTLDPLLIAEFEKILYGDQFSNASLIPMADLVARINAMIRYEIIDNGDGTWTAVTEQDDLVTIFGTLFQIRFINAWYLDETTYQVTSTIGDRDVPQIRIWHNEPLGTWTATTDYDALIVDLGNGEVDILNANVVTVDANTYDISDTPDD